jgi:hypothetical protein
MSEAAVEQTDWDLIWTHQADDEFIREVIARSAAEIESFLLSDDQTEEETLALLGRRLSGRLDPTTYDVILEALRALLGRDGAGAVLWYIVGDGGSTGILEEVAPARVAFFVRRIAAAHQPEFQAAFGLWRESPEDWRVITRDVHYDLINERYVVRHRIHKLNGDVIVIEGNANSVLDLTRSLLASIRLIASREAFTETSIEAFLAEADSALALLRPEEEPTQNGDVIVGGFEEPSRP